jgi:hypothetical protein
MVEGSRPPDGFRCRTVVDAEGRPMIGAHVGVEPRDLRVRIALGDDAACIAAVRCTWKAQTFFEVALNEIAGHLHLLLGTAVVTVR